jgi:hypothetical protein
MKKNSMHQKLVCDRCGEAHGLEIRWIYLSFVRQFDEELRRREPNPERIESLRTLLYALQRRFPWLVEPGAEPTCDVDTPAGEA